MSLSGFSLRHERAIAFLTAVLTAAGAWAYLRTPASIFPEMHFSRIDVVADAGNLPPEQVRVAVTMPLERAFLGLPSVSRVLATSSQGSSELVAEFDPKTEAVTDLQYVNSAIEQARVSLPANTAVQANIVTPQTEPVLSYALTSTTLSQTLMREYAQTTLEPAFYGIPGLGRILVAGGADREYHVDLDPAALAASGIGARDVGNAIAQANDVTAVGLSQSASQRSAILVDAGLRDASQIERIAVPTRQGASVTVGSLGSVRLGVAPATNQVAYDARHAVSINFYAVAGADNVRMAGAIKTRIAALSAEMPAAITLHRYWDATDLIVASQESLRDAIVAGALLALGVIFFFLRHLRMTLISALVIPAAMAIAILAISTLGQTLNIMSLGGLAIAVGLIIDDAIVVVEGIAHTLHETSLGVREAIVATMQRLIKPMTASTLTTVVVFIPLSLLGGVSGAFFRTLALTLTCALLVSLALAIFVTPMLARLLLAHRTPHDENRAIAHALERYEPILRWALTRRRSVYAAAGGVLVLTVALLSILPSDFLPRLDEGQFEIDYQMPVGTNLAASDDAAFALERVVDADPAVVDEGRFTGIDTNGFSPTPVRSGIIRVKLEPLGRRASFDTVSDRLREAMSAAVPSAILDVHQILEDMINDVTGAPAPIQIVITGNDQGTLVRSATRVAGELQSDTRVADVFSGAQQDDPTLRVQPNFSRLVRSGADTGSLASAIAAGTQGNVVTSLPASSMLVPVRVRVMGSADDPNVSLPGGNVPLSVLATTTLDRSSTDVTEINGQRAIVVTANLGSGTLSSAVAAVRSAIARAHLPPGYRASIEGAYQQQRQSFAQFALTIAVAIVLVFFVMLASFGSFRQPLVVLAAVPLAPVGVALGLTFTATPFNVSSFMGLLLLVGLVVKNGILLIDAANRRRAEGQSIDDALVLAGRERLRPILMTTFAAIAGLLPLAFGIGAGAAMERPLAIAVVGGLSTATLFTLVLIPVLYATFVREDAVHV